MAKDKKSKIESKRNKLLEKKQKQEKKGAKKAKIKASKVNDSDGESVDLDAVLADYAKQQEVFLKITETVCSSPPRPRSSATLIASPANANELFLFGGEYFNGAQATFFNDLYVYVISKEEWRLVTSPNCPLPRSGHAWCRGTGGAIWLFGGEFSSPKQGTFYHYNDFWRLEPATREWSRVETKGKSPPARSGHRMQYFKKYIVLFGGFQDTSQQTKYLADLWIYDTQNFTWHTHASPLATQKPDARSSFTLLPHDSGCVLYGGYSRVKINVVGKQTKGGGPSSRNILKPMIHQDCFFLRILQPNAGAPPTIPPTIRWERRKRPTNSPMPHRAGATMAYHKGRGIMFGGVHDVEESEEGIESEFFNQLFAWNIERNRFFPLALRKARSAAKARGNERGGRKGRGQANEEELLRNLAALGTGNAIEDVEVETQLEEPEALVVPVREASMELPHPRFNAQLTVQDDVLYIYGGTFEKGDVECTLDEMYAIDLVKLDGVRQIFHREPENWLGSSDSDSSDGEEESEGDGSFEDEDDDAEGENDDVQTADSKPLFTESKRASKLKSARNEEKEAEEASSISTFDDTPEESSATTSVEDHLPHPRPFESRKEFFQRTGNDWQEVLMTSLRWKGVQPETLSVKEIKTQAFEMSEAKWWDCREEILALEDEQEASGIGEVVALGERGDAGGLGRRR